MADGVIIRIEGDDAPFQKTLAGIEPAVQAALRGVSASEAAVLRGISAQMEAADFAGAGSAAMDALAAGMENVRYYPDPQMRRSRVALAEYLGL